MPGARHAALRNQQVTLPVDILPAMNGRNSYGVPAGFAGISSVGSPERRGLALTLGSVLGRGHGLGKGDEVAAGVLDREFLHAVEGSAHGHDHSYVFHGGTR